MVLERSGSAAMGAAGEPPPGKEPVMRALRRAVVLMVLLGLSLGAPGVFAANRRPEAPRAAKTAAWSGVPFLAALRSRIAGWMKAGAGSDPLGSPQAGSANGAPAQSLDSGCGIEPLGLCSSGH